MRGILGKYWENILISQFNEQFSRSSQNLGHFWKFEKISNKHIIYHFEVGDLEIFFLMGYFEIMYFAGCEDKSNNVFREVLKCFRRTAKFEFFAKQIIYLESPDHPLQNDISYLCFKSLKFFRTSKNGLKSDYFAKIAHKIAKLKYFSDI